MLLACGSSCRPVRPWPGLAKAKASCPRRELQANRLRTGGCLTATRPNYVTAALHDRTNVLLPDTSPGCSHSATELSGLDVGPG